MSASAMEVISSIVTAVAAVATALAYCAAQSWRRGLENQRADECISAARDVRSAIDRCFNFAENDSSPSELGAAVDGAWNSWRRLDQAYAVALRYRADLPDALPDMIARQLDRVRPYCLRNWKATGLENAEGLSERDEIKRMVRDLAREIEMNLNPQWLKRIARAKCPD